MDQTNKHADLDQLSGRALREAISHLDERQVLSLIQQLVDEREQLLKRQEHLSSLSRLWERTITEADDIANQLKQEAKEQAEAEAQVILAQAKESSEQSLRQSRVEADEAARKEIQSIAAELKGQLESFSAKNMAELESRLNETARQVSQATAAYVEALKGQFDAFQKSLEDRLSNREISTAEPQGPDVAAPLVTETETPAAAAPDLADDHAAPVDEPSPIGIVEHGMEVRERRVIEVLAPRDKARIEALREQLSGLEGVVRTEVKHLVDRTLIEIMLDRYMDLTQILSRMPEIERAQQVTVEGQTRTQIMLGVETELAREKDVLNSRVNRIAKRIRSFQD